LQPKLRRYISICNLQSEVKGWIYAQSGPSKFGLLGNGFLDPLRSLGVLPKQEGIRMMLHRHQDEEELPKAVEGVLANQVEHVVDGILEDNAIDGDARILQRLRREGHE